MRESGRGAARVRGRPPGPGRVPPGGLPASGGGPPVAVRGGCRPGGCPRPGEALRWRSGAGAARGAARVRGRPSGGGPGRVPPGGLPASGGGPPVAVRGGCRGGPPPVTSRVFAVQLLQDLLPRREGGGFAQAPLHALRLAADHEGVCGVVQKGIGDSPLVEFLCHGSLEFCATEASNSATPASSPSVIDMSCWILAMSTDISMPEKAADVSLPSLKWFGWMCRQRRSLPSRSSPFFKRCYAPSPRSGRAAVPISRCCRRMRASQILRLTARR